MKKFKGFDISVEDFSVDDGRDYIFVNFDKNGRAGGYVSIKLDDDGVSVDAFNGDGDICGSTYVHWEELDPTENSHEDDRL